MIAIRKTMIEIVMEQNPGYLPDEAADKVNAILKDIDIYHLAIARLQANGRITL